jgi:signal transduction histidine kinase
MRNIFERVPFRFINYIYWFLLLYLLAALAWWYIELVQQNELMYSMQKNQILQSQIATPNISLNSIEDERLRNSKQYVGEGLTFLIITILGAVFVYGVVRRQLHLHLQQRNFMLAVTHELKTPIAVTKLSLETLKRHNLEELKKEEILNNAINETDRLNSLCNNILLSAQLDSGGYKMSKHDFDFTAMASAAVNEFKKRYPKRSFEFDIPPEIFYYGEEFLIRLVINNLLENAVKYTPADKPIVVSIEQNDKQKSLVLKVADLGQGIPENEKLKVFEKFYRIGDEMKRLTKGTGLGLFLSKKIIEDHHGHMKVENNMPTGSVFIVRLPK